MPADLCVSYDPRVERARDGSQLIFPKKTTANCTMGLDEWDIVYKRCHKDCPMLRPGTNTHRVGIMKNANTPDEQERIDPELNSLLPIRLNAHDT